MEWHIGPGAAEKLGAEREVVNPFSPVRVNVILLI